MILADIIPVQRSTVIGGVLLAASAVTIAGIAEWATGGFRLPGSAVSGTSEYVSGGYSELRRNVPPSAEPVPKVAVVPAPSGTEYLIRKTVPEVTLQFAVADDHGRLVHDLSANDFRITEDDAPVPELQSFARNNDLPVHLGMLLDTSDSVTRILPQEKKAASGFLEQVLRPEIDHAFVMAFGSDIRVWQADSADRPALMEAVARAKEPAGSTQLYDALYNACAKQFPANDHNDLAHRVLVLLTDGEDTGSIHGLADVISMAQRNEVQVYALTIHGKGGFFRGDGILARIADQTGGRFFIAPSSDRLEDVFAEIEQEIRSQYLVTFRPRQRKPGYHALHVEVRAPEKLQVFARQGYYATNE